MMFLQGNWKISGGKKLQESGKKLQEIARWQEMLGASIELFCSQRVLLQFEILVEFATFWGQHGRGKSSAGYSCPLKFSSSPGYKMLS